MELSYVGSFIGLPTLPERASIHNGGLCSGSIGFYASSIGYSYADIGAFVLRSTIPVLGAGPAGLGLRLSLFPDSRLCLCEVGFHLLRILTPGARPVQIERRPVELAGPITVF